MSISAQKIDTYARCVDSADTSEPADLPSTEDLSAVSTTGHPSEGKPVEPCPHCIGSGIAGDLPPHPDVSAMVSRFLTWRLPATFSPDGGVTFNKKDRDPNSHWWPVGTNILNAEEAKQMIEHVLDGALPPHPDTEKKGGSHE